jgi:hypothetical protein
VASLSRASDETGLSALCKAVAPVQVQVSYCATNALPFRVEWNAEMTRISFAGATPDEAAERALAALRRRALPAHPRRAERATEPSVEPDFAEAMRERIWDIEEKRRRKRPTLRLVR